MFRIYEIVRSVNAFSKQLIYWIFYKHIQTQSLQNCLENCVQIQPFPDYGNQYVDRYRNPDLGFSAFSLTPKNDLNEFSRVALSQLCVRSLTGLHVIRMLETLFPVWGVRIAWRSDNGSEFVARQVKKWLLDHGISTQYIDPGSPWQNPLSRASTVSSERLY